MIKKLTWLLLLAVILGGCQSQKKIAGTAPPEKKKKEDFKKYKEVITGEAQSDDGLFTTHLVDEDLYYEIPDSLFNKDMLWVSRIAKVPAGYGGGYVNAGSKVNEQVVRWVRRGKHIDLKVMSFENESDEGSPIHISVANNNFRWRG